MAANAPDKIIVFLNKPLVAKSLYIKVMDFKARVVHMVLGTYLL